MTLPDERIRAIEYLIKTRDEVCKPPRLGGYYTARQIREALMKCGRHLPMASDFQFWFEHRKQYGTEAQQEINRQQFGHVNPSTCDKKG